MNKIQWTDKTNNGQLLLDNMSSPKPKHEISVSLASFL